jgi:hypothetical protein
VECPATRRSISSGSERPTRSGTSSVKVPKIATLMDDAKSEAARRRRRHPPHEASVHPPGRCRARRPASATPTLAGQREVRLSPQNRPVSTTDIADTTRLGIGGGCGAALRASPRISVVVVGAAQRAGRRGGESVSRRRPRAGTARRSAGASRQARAGRASAARRVGRRRVSRGHRSSQRGGSRNRCGLRGENSSRRPDWWRARRRHR